MFHGWTLTPRHMSGVLPRSNLAGWARDRIFQGRYAVSDMVALGADRVLDAERALARRVPVYALGILDTGAVYVSMPTGFAWIGNMHTLLFPHLDLSAPDHTLARSGVVSLAAERLLRAISPRAICVLDDKALLKLAVQGLHQADVQDSSLPAVLRGITVQQGAHWVPLAA